MSFDPLVILADRFSKAIAEAFPDAGNPDPMVSAGRNPKFGDFQCNAAMTLAKTLGQSPRDVAKAILAKVDVSDIAEPLTEASIAGPGFINVVLKPSSLGAMLGTLRSGDLGVEPVGKGKTVVVDLCGVNLAKEMHVGHLRSCIIGDSLARTLARVGYTVIRQNHVGDWGLPIAMVTAKLMDVAAAGRDIAHLTLDDLEKLYRGAKIEADADAKGLAAVKRFNLGPKASAELEEQVAGAEQSMAKAKRVLLDLQAHEPKAMSFWQRIVDVTMAACVKTCARLNVIVTTEHSAGESSYAEELAGLVADLEKRGVAEVSAGALVVRVEGIDEPCLVRKTDGAYLYATTDMAAIRRRVQKFGAERVIYCVDQRQALHFKQVFGSATRAGYATRAGAAGPSRLEHAGFGMVLGDDGRPFKTRSGDNVKLADLIDEAIERAERVVSEKSPELSPAERHTVAEAVGVAAIKYADLSSDRVKDYVFNFDRMLAFEGNTGPYLLYALVRVRKILAKAREAGIAGSGIVIAAPEEKTLALQLLRYPGVLASVTASLEPHRLCTYLYELCTSVSVFYDKCPVLSAPDAGTKASRVGLCELTERVLSDALTVLGIKLLDRM
ncbi:MAG: arginine--tRNA ligase [Phycisphaerales bacterium]|nr:arginine--tRNA ligase [Phycisphaerales bacterium]